MSLSYRGKFYIYLGVTACCIGGLVFLAWFLFGMITDADTRVLDAKRELLALAMKQEQMGTITKEYETVRDLLPTLDDMLLPRSEKLQFIMLVEELAARAGVRHVIEAVDDAQTGKKDAPVLATTSFNVTVYGSFPHALQFIYLLESAKTYLSIERAQIANAGGGVFGAKKDTSPLSKDDVKVQLSVKVYTRQ